MRFHHFGPPAQHVLQTFIFQVMMALVVALKSA
jgi:hypothetical protein